MDQDAQHIRAEIEATRDRMGATVDALAYQADVPSRMRDKVNDRIEAVRSRAGDAVESVTSTFTAQADDAAASIRKGRQQVKDQLNTAKRLPQNPLGLAIATFAVGLIAGLVVPVTNIEREKLQPLQDQLVEKVETLHDSVMEHGKAVVEETLAAAKQSGQEHAQQFSEDLKAPTMQSL